MQTHGAMIIESKLKHKVLKNKGKIKQIDRLAQKKMIQITISFYIKHESVLIMFFSLHIICYL